MVARGESLLPVFASLCRHVEALCDGSLCSVHTIAADRKRLRIGAAPSLPKALFDIHDGQFIDGRDPCSLAATDAAAIAATDLAGDSRWVGSPWLSITQSLGFGSCFALPIISTSGVVSGVVAIYRSRPVMPALQQREQELIDRFTKIAGIAIDRNQAVARPPTSARRYWHSSEFQRWVGVVGGDSWEPRRGRFTIWTSW